MTSIEYSKQLESTVKFVQEAINRFALHDSLKYNFLVQQLNNPFNDKIMTWIQSLTQCTTLIQPSHTELVNALYSIKLPPSQPIYEVYGTLLLHLVTANTAHVQGALNSLFLRIIPDNEAIFPVLVTLFQKFIGLVPLSSRVFPQIFTKCVPTRWRPINEFCTYILFFLKAVRLIPEVAGLAVLASIDRAVLYDSELQKSTELFAMEENDTASSLDSIISFLLGWIKDIPLELEQSLFIAFDAYVARANYLTHVPIVYLTYCYTEERCCKFVKFLIENVQNHNINDSYRALYICHLGGFVADSTLLPAAITLDVINQIGEIFKIENNVVIKLLLCQQVFRIINNKIIELQTRTDISGLFGQQSILVHMIIDQCNPLGNCSQKTVREFVNICKEKQLIDPQQVLAQHALLSEPQFISCPLCSYDPYDVPSTFRESVKNLIVERHIDEVQPTSSKEESSWQQNSWDFSL
ncbi:hypothetical protein ENUP19_0057G0031 [Entamoeba nuttalli]|uniref:Uncharacterized protein n=1 Tax=Entamoeba nuttalli TaxID=412467 RepID=A0ABQ0DD91_9EUKA